MLSAVFNYVFAFVLLLLGFILFNGLFMSEEHYCGLSLDLFTFMIFVLCFVVVMMLNSYTNNYRIFVSMMMVTVMVIVYVSSIVTFMFMYEFLFVLIMFSLVLMGYSYERLMASFMMMFYSFIFSGPVMMMLLLVDKVYLLESWNSSGFMVSLFLTFSFIVKFPIFGFHYWLPVAHVEASTIGSIILASVLLKIGGVGLWYTHKYFSFSMKWHWVMVGVVIIMVFVIMTVDLKMMVAYSSVAHMTMVFYSMSLNSFFSVKGSFYMMFYHGVISSLLFWSVGLLASIKSRSMVVVKIFHFSALFNLIVFMICILNMSFPPFMGFVSEILMIKTIMEVSSYAFVFSLMAVLLSCFYNMYFFMLFYSYSVKSAQINVSGMSVMLLICYVTILILFC